jgi:nickel/cobalt transporter (NiCoT) family protein
VTLRARIVVLFALLGLANLAAWSLAFAFFHGQPLLLGTALLAWSFGLRHAVDADHIAAIDNVTRKLRQDGKRPLTVGLWFALGHSTVVTLAAAAVAVTTTLLATRFEAVRAIGSAVGTIISAFFLFAIAAVNLVTLRQTWRAWRGDGEAAPALDGGLLARICRPVFRLIDSSWQMFPLGFLFGLGFDTASEVSLLGLSATSAAGGLPIGAILIFPALFAAGMALVDTADGVLMLGAYDWAFVNPRRKLAYNLVLTGGSVVVAIVVGALELLGIEIEGLGFAVVGLFGLLWLAALALGRDRGPDGDRLHDRGLDSRDAPADAPGT